LQFNQIAIRLQGASTVNAHVQAAQHLAAPNPSKVISVRTLKHALPLADQAALLCLAATGPSKHFVLEGRLPPTGK
jgi:hypothetical protein